MQISFKLSTTASTFIALLNLNDAPHHQTYCCPSSHVQPSRLLSWQLLWYILHPPPLAYVAPWVVLLWLRQFFCSHIRTTFLDFPVDVCRSFVLNIPSSQQCHSWYAIWSSFHALHVFAQVHIIFDRWATLYAILILLQYHFISVLLPHLGMIQ